MASQSTGIQQLLAAEKRAAEKVGEARKRKARRLKQAKEEAQAEVEAYRKEREAQFKAHEGKIMGTKGDMESKVDIETQQKIKEINANVQKTREQTMASLLTLVYDIKPELHINLRL
ncbi:unnamed protein product [Owenia fusiformis]|uniref:V-type proton ATPase subunit G n=1 Tax=Owenia fusiformis TaxID=6347 RepID=A0A8S4NXB3_OWEFU|nr:unnamed protein product [Owenia fusiformis]